MSRDKTYVFRKTCSIFRPFSTIKAVFLWGGSGSLYKPRRATNRLFGFFIVAAKYVNTKVQHKHCSSHVCLVRVFNILNVLGRGTTDLFGSYIVHCMYSTMYYMYNLRPYKGLQEEEDDRYGRPGMP